MHFFVSLLSLLRGRYTFVQHYKSCCPGFGPCRCMVLIWEIVRCECDRCARLVWRWPIEKVLLFHYPASGETCYMLLYQHIHALGKDTFAHLPRTQFLMLLWKDVFVWGRYYRTHCNQTGKQNPRSWYFFLLIRDTQEVKASGCSCRLLRPYADVRVAKSWWSIWPW